MRNDAEITPALTADEWHDASGVEGPTALERAGLWAQLKPGSILVARTPGDRCCLIAEDDAHAMMALANAALPDGDARKITREDVELIREVAQQFIGIIRQAVPVAKRLDIDVDACHADALLQCEGMLESVAARIAALLPPN